MKKLLTIKTNFFGTQESYTIDDSYTFKENEFLMDKPIDLGFAVFELSKLLMHATYCDNLPPYFNQVNLQLHFMECDSFVLSIRTRKFIHTLKNWTYLTSAMRIKIMSFSVTKQTKDW